MCPHEFEIVFLFLLPECIVPAKLSLAYGADPGQVRFPPVGQNETEAYTAQQQVFEVDNALSIGCPAEFRPEYLCSRDEFQFTGMRPPDQVRCAGPVATLEPFPR